MNSPDIDLFKVYVVLSPFLVGAVGLAVFWLTGWMDRREEQQRHPAE